MDVEARQLKRRTVLLALMPLALIAVGTLGYVVIEGWSAFDALYMTVITLTTIGFGETRPLHAAGRVFTMVLALTGIFTLFYAASEVLRAVITGAVAELLQTRRREKRMAALENHVIVCGYGRMGRHICQEFARDDVPFVVIDRDRELLAAVSFASGTALVGDATDDDVLRRAGIGRARALVVAVANDADNVFITMTARLLQERIPIVARAEEEATIPKLVRAGATRVVSPYLIGGGRVAQAVLRPAVLDFIEVATRSEHLALQIEELGIAAGSRLDGQELGRSELRGELGLIVVANKSTDGHMRFNPADDTRLRAGDTLIVLGRREQLDRADRLARV